MAKGGRLRAESPPTPTPTSQRSAAPTTLTPTAVAFP